jgi:Protein of unknown function (DUF3224)
LKRRTFKSNYFFGIKTMPFTAKGIFAVEIEAQTEPQISDDVALGRMSLDKTFEGDIKATSHGEMLSALTPIQGSAGYVAIERVTGSVHGRNGSFVFQHSGTMHGADQRLSITVVPDSGTGALRGISGSFTINMMGTVHAYEFEYSLPQ